MNNNSNQSKHNSSEKPASNQRRLSRASTEVVLNTARPVRFQASAYEEKVFNAVYQPYVVQQNAQPQVAEFQQPAPAEAAAPVPAPAPEIVAPAPAAVADNVIDAASRFAAGNATNEGAENLDRLKEARRNISGVYEAARPVEGVTGTVTQLIQRVEGFNDQEAA